MWDDLSFSGCVDLEARGFAVKKKSTSDNNFFIFHSKVIKEHFIYQ